MARKIRRQEAAGKHPAQSMAGYYPKTYKPVTRSKAREKKGVTASEALAAFANEPKADMEKQRVAFYGARAKDDFGDSDFIAGQTDVKSSAAQRGSMIGKLREIQADSEAYRAQLEMDALTRYGPSPPTQIASMLKREIPQQAQRYEESLMAEWASGAMGPGYKYTKVLGVWVAE